MPVLTDAKARSLKPADKPVAHGGVKGLTLHPSTTRGRGKWVFRFVSPVTGKRRNAGVGSYPEVGVAEAARLAQGMREQLNAGIDPLLARSEEKTGSPAPSVPTFESAARAVHRDLLPGWKNAKHGKQWMSTLEQYAFPVLANVTLDRITPALVADCLRPVWLEIPETASRVKQRLHAVMAWGWAHGHCAANPVDVVGFLLPQQPGKAVRTEHQPAMPWRDIPAFVAEHLAGAARFDTTRAILEFLILTAARSGEVRGMTWNEVDFDASVWTVPADRMKARLPHRVPLSDRAVEILRSQEGLHEELVFPSPRAQTILSDMVLTSFLRRVNAASSTPGRVATAHGFRSSFRDWCSEQGYPRDLAERALAHTVANKVEAAYHRTDLLEQRREMMAVWSRFISGENHGRPCQLMPGSS
ncbi:tyrosine-type recombinase/integrase [Laribacter hongkongensis]|uniref:tyrosine-type recombinase/integrase n=1 Tax=Laribacter hongkongensis TaxID=168471 RepID=UPI001EFD7AB3|nr:tyrosine-type recombinase/integrase [Laribacter hongkongensis]MCG9055145.1 tyrosine-type recombinase/integrase [Laribacter hongkongensis]MCG9114812.1 tyrosine-type recombinase/integrase [Laribacter hongkongensis]